MHFEVYISKKLLFYLYTFLVHHQCDSNILLIYHYSLNSIDNNLYIAIYEIEVLL